MSITLPEIKLTLPRLELPACYHTRSESKMLIDHAEAPYVRTGTTTRQVAAQAPAEKDLPPKDCETRLKELQEDYRQLKEQLDRCLNEQKGLKDAVRPATPAPRKSLSPLQGQGEVPVPVPDPADQRRNSVHPAAHISDEAPVQNSYYEADPSEVFQSLSSRSPGPNSASRPVGRISR